jgi:hypothetical protein
MELNGSLINMQLGTSACAMPERGAQNEVCNLDNYMGIYGLNSTNSTDEHTLSARV